MFQTLYLKIAGGNILRASVCAKMQELVHAKAQIAVLRLSVWVRTAFHACGNAVQSLPGRIWAFHGSFAHCPPLTRAA